jgi:DHA1 family tetracycline resistance protein-like MFS transporter
MKKLREKMADKALPAVFFTIFLDVLGIGVLIPVMPLLVIPGPERIIPASWSLTSGFILLGWLTAIYPLMQFFATPILGQLSDRYGRRRILSISLFGTAIGYVLFAVGIITKNIPLLFASRALDGITGGNMSVAQAVIADVTPPEKRTRNFGLIGAMFGLGFVTGPYIGSKLASPGIEFFGLFKTPSWFGPAVPFWFTAGLSIFNVLLILFLLPETNKHIERLKKIDFSRSIHNIIKAATYPGLRVVFPSTFLYWFGFTFFTTFFQVLLFDKLGFNQANVGDYFAYVGICIAITQAVITPQIAKRFKNYQVLRVSLAGTGLGLLALLAARNTTELLLVTPLFAIMNGQTLANSVALVSASADKKVQGEVLGINASVQALAQSIPAAISGYVAAISVSTPVVVGGSIMVFGGLLFWVLYHPGKHVLHDESAAEAAPVH